MGRITLSVRAFFGTLFNSQVAQSVEQLLSAPALPAPSAEQPEKKPATPKKSAPAKKPARSEAITLLATLQREARFLDFIKEPLDGYSDAQVGAVVRDVHRDSAAVLERLFAITPQSDAPEMASIEVPVGFDAGMFRLVGNVQGDPPFQGKLVHHGWKATRCELPSWSGSAEGVLSIAPAEVELS